MEYHIFCNISLTNKYILYFLGITPELSKYESKWYVNSYLDKEWAQIALMQLNQLEGLECKENKITAKEENYKRTLMNIQYRISRFTRRFYELSI